MLEYWEVEILGFFEYFELEDVLDELVESCFRFLFWGVVLKV